MENEAEEQLALIADTRARLAARLTTPWWYHLSLAALMGVLVLAIGFGVGTGWFGLVVAVVVVGEGVLIGAYRSTMGVWTATWDGFPSSTVWVAFGVALALFAASAAVHLWTAVVWPIWVLAAVTVVGFVALGRWTDAVWRRRLRADA
jgi:cation transport ATPase